MNRRPAGWPARLPGPEHPDWPDPAVSWLLDQGPGDWRLQPVLRRQPFALAWLTQLHVAAQEAALLEAASQIRVELRDHLPPGAIEEVLLAIEVDRARLGALKWSVGLVRATLLPS